MSIKTFIAFWCDATGFNVQLRHSHSVGSRFSAHAFNAIIQVPLLDRINCLAKTQGQKKMIPNKQGR